MLFNGRALIFTFSGTQVRIAEHERLQSLFKMSMVSSDNYRGISLVNLMCKLIDIIIIIEKCQVYLHKAEHSTNMCTAVFTETVSYFVDRGSNVYACLLDASKAFDRVHYGKLFSLLLNRKMPAFFIRLILDSYLRQTTCTKWKGCIYNNFSVKNGFKQGGVLSPLLFTVYFDELISRLKSSGLGCNIGDNYFGALGYVDDLTLLSPSVNALTKMITICEIFANEYSVMFNAKKTAGIQFGQQKELCEIKLNGQVINWRTSVKQLGNVVDNNLSDKSDCRSKRAAFIGSAHRCIGNYNYHRDCTKRKLWQAYCSSFYGSPLWLCKSNGFTECCTAWRKATRRFF